MMHEDAILIVEDDDDIREALTAFLEAAGYSVIEAKDGGEALRMLRSTRQRFCLVLLDLFMPAMNGWQFRAEQLGDPAIADVPVVIVSADRSAPQKAADLGAVDCMVKPIDFVRLLDTIAALC